jgi:tetratricopeptide (TPR) repeat protein
LPAIAPAASAAGNSPPPRPQLTDTTLAQLPKLSVLLEKSDYAGLLALVDEVLVEAAPDSFDRALLIQLRGQILLNSKRYSEAIVPLEESLRLAAGKNWFDTDTTLQVLQTLSQLYYQEASDAKTNPDRRKNLRLALARINQWLALTRRPTAEVHFYAATLHYTDATLDQANPDPVALQAAIASARTSLSLRSKYEEQPLVIIIAALQQLNRYEEAAEHIELLLTLRTDNALYWQQLFGIYANLAGTAKLPSQVRHWQTRSLVTQERARKHGHLATAQDHFNTVAILFALRQYEPAALTLETGLSNGTLPTTRQNWELLSSAWQQQRAPERAIAALKKAIEKLPKDGELRVSLARLYLGAEKPAEAFEQTRLALDVGSLTRPGEVWFLLAYLAYELQRFDDAAKYIKTASEQPGVKAGDLASLQNAINAALEVRGKK